MLKPTPLPALHGTRSPQGRAVAHPLAPQVHDRLRAAGADVVADPLCPDPAIAQAVAERFHQALATSTT
ncbi:hypothetical protein [Nocardiopsis alkaliphila]|uniref:hypothetical protein n=1 Tax=Nocardiopsis alkaliphila TaxID=225762 RepID=UPI00034A6ACE|nr:hypothetical protein [Nocardiopsis alkaliphila]